MKIALLHYTAPPVVGGVESVIGHHARLLTQDGHEVLILAGRGEETDERIRFVHLPLVDSLDEDILAMRKDLDGGRIPTRFKDIVEQQVEMLVGILADSDCLIAHNVCSLNKNLALTAALHQITQQAKKPRMILWHHDLAWTTPRYRHEVHDGYPWDLLRTAWPGVTQVTVSNFRRRELAGLYQVPEAEIHVVPNGIDAGSFLKLGKQAQDFLHRLDLLNAFPLMLLPARITPRKNIELALHVLACLRKTYHSAMLVVTGPPGPHNPGNQPYLGRLLALRQELGLMGSAHFLTELWDGFLPDETVRDFYRLADLLFLPSLEEGFGIPILEAGLAGIPVFCADIPPLRELGDPFVDLFSPDAEPEAVAERISAQLGDAQIGLRARVRSRYTWEQIYQGDIAPLLEEG